MTHFGGGGDRAGKHWNRRGAEQGVRAEGRRLEGAGKTVLSGHCCMLRRLLVVTDAVGVAGGLSPFQCIAGPFVMKGGGVWHIQEVNQQRPAGQHAAKELQTSNGRRGCTGSPPAPLSKGTPMHCVRIACWNPHTMPMKITASRDHQKTSASPTPMSALASDAEIGARGTYLQNSGIRKPCLQISKADFGLKWTRSLGIAGFMVEPVAVFGGKQKRRCSDADFLRPSPRTGLHPQNAANRMSSLSGSSPEASPSAHSP